MLFVSRLSASVGGPQANAAVPSSGACVDVCVFWRVLVALRTVRSGAKVGAGSRTRRGDVFGDGHNSQVRRVDAPSMPTQMVGYESARNHTAAQLVGDSVRLPEAELAIAAESYSAGPLPAIGFIERFPNLFPERLWRWCFGLRDVLTATRAELRSGPVAFKLAQTFSAGLFHSSILRQF